MTDQEQIMLHKREIGELRGKLDALATKEFVRSRRRANRATQQKA